MVSKRMIHHTNVTLETIVDNTVDYLKYLKHDVELLGHIMVRAQQIFFEYYKVDIVDKTTIAAMAFTI